MPPIAWARSAPVKRKMVGWGDQRFTGRQKSGPKTEFQSKQAI